MLSQLVRLAVLLSAAVAVAPAPAPAPVPAAAAPQPVLYRLDKASSLAEGCQAPCLCPVLFTDDLVGTMTVTFDHSTANWFDHYRVEDVNWIVGFGANERRVTGRGTYRVGGQLAVQQQLTLDLSFDGQAPVHYDSGLVLGGAGFPSIDVGIDLGTTGCFNSWISVSASPVPAGEIVRYHLRGSSYEEGCQPPCLCPIFATPADGSFGLVDLGPATDPNFQHFALVKTTWKTDASFGGTPRVFKGFGTYSVDVLGIEHRLVCDMREAGQKVQRFDSGWASGGFAGAPMIDIDAAVNGFFCFDQVWRIVAVP
ncbi:MAG: hypothetical protein R3F34_15800 [Planctomycetota bacterium]